MQGKNYFGKINIDYSLNGKHYFRLLEGFNYYPPSTIQSIKKKKYS